MWFKVDDRFHSHPKAAAASLAAIGLWAVAGSWAGDHTTDGEIPEHMIPSLSRGATGLADELVSCGLWRRTKAGYRFHQWSANGDGQKRNPTRKEIEEERRRKAEAGRKGGLARANGSSRRQAPARAPATGVLAEVPNNPTRPLPSTKEGRGARAASGPTLPRDAPRCARHPDQPSKRCGTCRSEQIGAA